MFKKKVNPENITSALMKSDLIPHVNASEKEEFLLKYHLPILCQDLPHEASQIDKPFHLLGVAGGVGVTTIAQVCNDPNVLLDFAQFDTRRCFVKYLEDVILVTNYSYSSILSLQGILQQYTNKKSFELVGFSPRIRGLIINDTVNTKPTKAVKSFLKYVATGIQNVWILPYFAPLQDTSDPLSVETLPKSFISVVNEIDKIKRKDMS